MSVYGKLLGGSLTGFLLVATPAAAMRWDELEREIHAVEAGKPGSAVLQQRMSDIVQALVIYTQALESRDDSAPLFCLPPGGSMSLDEVVSMVRAQAREDSADAGESVQALALRAFRRRYPCPD